AYSGQVCFTESAPVTVSIYPAPIVKFDAVEPLCENSDPIQLIAKDENNVPGNYVFSGTGVSGTGVFSPRLSGPGNFNIKYVYTSDNGCVEEKNVNITVDKLPVRTMPPDMDILLGGRKTIDVAVTGTTLKYKWSPAEGLSADNIPNPIAKPEKTTKYTLTVSSNTCE